jgi:peptide/nickel transport system substrate-binding protein
MTDVHDPFETHRLGRRAFIVRTAGGALSLTSLGGLLAACGGSAKPENANTTHAAGVKAPATPTGTLRVAIPGEPNFIDPSAALEITEFAMTVNVYEGLLEWSQDYSKLVPGLATAWTTSPDAKEWTFKLRSGVTFHDGAPFDEQAVKDSFKHFEGGGFAFALANLKRIDTSRPGEVRAVFSKPSPDFGRNQTVIRMMSPKLLAAKAESKRASGTGRYKLTSWVKGQRLLLDAVPGHWSGQGPYLQQIELRPIAEQATAINALNAGDVDLVMKVAPRQVQTLSRNHKFGIHTKQSWVEGNLLFRCDQPPTDDVRVRQAIAYAIDRQALVDRVLIKQASVAHTPMPPETYGHFDVLPDPYPHDPAKAKQLLAQAGHPNGLSVKFSVFAGIRVLGEEVCQAIVQMLADAGIKADLDIQEPGVAVKDALAPHPVHQLFHLEYGWSNGGPLHFTLGNALNHAKYTGKDLVDPINRMSATADGPERLALLKQIQTTFMQRLPHLPLYHLKLTDVSTAKLQGYINPTDGYAPRFWWAYLA